MAIFCDAATRVLVQGMTGSEGRRHTARMLAAGTVVVGGVNPSKGGQTVEFDVNGATQSLPVFATVRECMDATGANASVMFVPPTGAKAAVIEAVDAGLPLVVVITEWIPVADATYFVAYAARHGTRVIGPNCPGIIVPGVTNLGIFPANIAGPGPLGLISKSGTLTYEMMNELADIGFSTCLGIGGDPVVGTTHIDALAAFEADPQTSAIVMIDEIGGDSGQRVADYIRAHVTKPVVGYVAGFTAPAGRRMGHAGAIVSGSASTAQAKKETLEAVGVRVGISPSQTAKLLREAL